MVQISVLGQLDVRRAGRPDHPRRGRTGKGRTLLAMLAVAGGAVVTADRVIDALWSRLPREPKQNVATLVSRLRAELGRAAILGGPTGYRLAPTIAVDLQQAATLVDRAGVQLADRSDTTLATAVAALQLLAQDTVLPEYPDADWARPARDWHANLLRRARTIAARSAVAVGHPDLAIAIADAAIRDDPLDEAAYRALMVAHLAADDPVHAVRAYQRLRRSLDHELGLHPTPATQHLLVHVLHHDTDPTTAPT